MTVPVNVSSIAYVGNGATTDFAVTFPYLDPTHLVVKVTPSGGVETVKTLGVHYTVSPTSGDSGTVHFLAAPGSGDGVVIERTVPIIQDIAFRTQGSFSPATHEEAFDTGTMIDQQLDRRVTKIEGSLTVNNSVAGNGLFVSGSTWHVGAGNGIQANADTLDVVYGATADLVTIDSGAANGGALNKAARADHKHTISVNTPGAIAIGDTAASGSNASLARSDHRHSLAAPAAPVNITKATADAGVSTAPARADHKHDVTTAAPVTIGTANSEGTNSSLARADHVHNHGAQTDGTLHAAATSLANGFMSASDKTKLDAYGQSYTATITTGDANPTVLLNIDAAKVQVYLIEAMVAAAANTGTQGAGYILSATFISNGTTVTQIGTTSVLSAQESNAAWDATIAASGLFIQVKVTGAAAVNISWRTRARLCEAP